VEWHEKRNEIQRNGRRMYEGGCQEMARNVWLQTVEGMVKEEAEVQRVRGQQRTERHSTAQASTKT